jgi:hypothetical protein
MVPCVYKTLAFFKLERTRKGFDVNNKETNLLLKPLLCFGIQFAGLHYPRISDVRKGLKVSQDRGLIWLKRYQFVCF